MGSAARDEFPDLTWKSFLLSFLKGTFAGFRIPGWQRFLSALGAVLMGVLLTGGLPTPSLCGVLSLLAAFSVAVYHWFSAVRL